MKNDLNKAAEWLKNYHRLTNYIASSMLYLKENFTLEEELTHEHIKNRILGHWGTVPGLNLIYGGLNYFIKKTKQETLLLVGPGHGAPAVLAGLWLEGTLEEFYPKASRNKDGLEYLIKHFSWPEGFPSHTYPGLPGSLHEGGELGYSLGTAYGTIFDNPELLTVCVVGDGEAETGPLAASWQANKFINPKEDGAVLPILHLNGYRISGPTIFGTMSDDEIRNYFYGLSYEPIFVDYYKLQNKKANSKSRNSDNENNIYLEFLKSLDNAYSKIKHIKEYWDPGEKIMWPIIILRTPKGWTGPDYLQVKTTGEYEKVEGNNLSHGIPLEHPKKDDYELSVLKKWLSSYNINELIEKHGKPIHELYEYIPNGEMRLGMNKHAIGGKQRVELTLPDTKNYSERIYERGQSSASEMVNFSQYIRDLFEFNERGKNFLLFSPDESESNELEAIFSRTVRRYIWPVQEHDKAYSVNGRIIEMLSEHVLQELFSGYLLTGRHGVFVSYEAFLGIVTNQIEQYIKFLKQSKDIKWREPLSSMNLISTSDVWRQEHNGFSHQNPTLINALLTKHSDLVNIYFPADVNTMLVTMEEAFKEINCVNLIITPKRNTPQWLSLEEAKKHVKEGMSIWHWVDTAHSDDLPDVVLASAGGYQTIETLAAIQIINQFIPETRIRYVNVNELTALGLGDARNPIDTDLEINKYFTKDREVIFNFHGYPEAIKQLTWGTDLSKRMKIRGYIEMGSTTTPFDMQVQNETSRFHIAIEAVKAASKHNPVVEAKMMELYNYCYEMLKKHKSYIVKYGDDIPEVREFEFKF